ncbi:bacterial Ig-like domain-containing protein [Pseudoscourfieldia marina]
MLPAVLAAVDIQHATSTAPGASKPHGGGYYTTGTSFTFTWNTVQDGTTTPQTLDGTLLSQACYCRMRAGANHFSSLWDFSTGGTAEAIGEDIGSITHTTEETNDSGLEAYGFDWKICTNYEQSTHTYYTGYLPDGYYVFSVTCKHGGAWTVESDGAFNWPFKVDNVAPASTITHGGTVSDGTGNPAANSFDPSPNSGHGWGASQNGIFNFALGATDYYYNGGANECVPGPWTAVVKGGVVNNGQNGGSVDVVLDGITAQDTDVKLTMETVGTDYNSGSEEISSVSINGVQVFGVCNPNVQSSTAYFTCFTDLDITSAIGGTYPATSTTVASSGVNCCGASGFGLPAGQEWLVFNRFTIKATRTCGTASSSLTTSNKVSNGNACSGTSTSVSDDPNIGGTQTQSCELNSITYLCAVDNGAYAACGGTISTLAAGTLSTTSLTAGEHVVRVKAVDKAGNTETYPSFYSFSVRPHAKNAGCTFRYDLDSAGYTSLGSTATKTLSGLTDGSHTFGVLAVDSVSNVGTAQSFTWTVDTTPPTATITKTWSAQNNPTSTAGTFAWSFSEAGSYSKYSTDGTTYTMPGTLTATTVTLAANTFPIGSRSFKVYGVDLLGNAGSAATDSFTVEPIDTVVSTTSDYACSGTASAAIASSSVTYTISATIDQNAAVSDYTYMYKLDSGSWKQGVHFPAFGIKGLSEGVHQLEAKAYTSAGVVDPTPVCRKFIIDMTAPVTTITAPGASSQGATATFGGKVTDANIMATGGTTYRVEKVGDASFSSVSGSVATAADGSFTITLSSLADGLYQVYVRHTDMAGNVGAETVVEWTVDTAVPNTMVSSGPSCPTAATTASFLFACDEPPCTYKYKVDSADNYSTSSSARLNLSSIAPGVHTIEVHAVDVAGNEDVSAAAYTWSVYDATTYASLEKAAGFSISGPAPLDYTPPGTEYVHL